ncbi:MAG: YARHG domain-containing protein, partial [Oscillospiraceae bacterium]|nr:YARHG domain-containing protein [Oscillospiraceae bacterium]
FPAETELIPAEYLSQLNRYDSYMLLNEIYARHGKIFKTAKIQKYFEEQSWYVPETRDSDVVEARFSDIELQNFRAIIDYQRSKGYRR